MPIAKYKKDKKSGLYYTYVKTGLFKPDGKPEYKKIRAKTIAKLEEKIEEAKKDSGVITEHITVDEWFFRWYDTYTVNLRQNTKRSYAGLYNNHVKPKIGKMRIIDVKQIHIQKLLNGLSDEYSIKTVKDIRGVITAMFSKAVSNGLIPYNPTARLEAAGKSTNSRRELTIEERKAYLAACKVHEFGEYAAVLYFFGLRRGEALALDGEDILDENISITKQVTFPGTNEPVVGSPKTKAGVRKIIIPDAAREYIDFTPGRTGAIFRGSGKNGYMLESEIDRKWKSFISFALGDDTDITQHCLRHNYCTMLFENGLNLLSAQILMGHDDPNTTTKVYTHYTEKIKLMGADKAKNIGKE